MNRASAKSYYHNIEDKQAISQLYWKDRLEREYAKRCKRCGRTGLDLENMHREEAEKYKTGGLCLYCQSEPPGDLAIPAWVNRILHWGVSSASRTKKTAAVADEADGCDVYEGGGSLGKEEEEADESDHEMDVGDEIMDADEKTTETKDDEEVFEMTS